MKDEMMTYSPCGHEVPKPDTAPPPVECPVCKIAELIRNEPPEESLKRELIRSRAAAMAKTCPECAAELTVVAGEKFGLRCDPCIERLARQTTTRIELEIPPEFVERCENDRVKPETVLRNFIGDLCEINDWKVAPRPDGYNSNGSDERMMANEYYERVGYGEPYWRNADPELVRQAEEEERLAKEEDAYFEAVERGEICELCDEHKKKDEQVCPECVKTAPEEIWGVVCPHCKYPNRYRPFRTTREGKLERIEPPFACMMCNGSMARE